MSDRTITKIELAPLGNAGRNWVLARWTRADGSSGEVFAMFRLKRAERYYIARLEIVTPNTQLLRDIPLARIEDAANANPTIREWIDAGMDDDTIERAKVAKAKRPKLKRAGALDDDFFRLVAEAYRGAVANGLPPAKTLALDSGAPPGTVNRWIGRAREKGYLPPGQAGRVTV
jgi:hypothetical protein